MARLRPLRTRSGEPSRNLGAFFFLRHRKDHPAAHHHRDSHGDRQCLLPDRTPAALSLAPASLRPAVPARRTVRSRHPLLLLFVDPPLHRIRQGRYPARRHLRLPDHLPAGERGRRSAPARIVRGAYHTHLRGQRPAARYGRGIRAGPAPARTPPLALGQGPAGKFGQAGRGLGTAAHTLYPGGCPPSCTRLWASCAVS